MSAVAPASPRLVLIDRILPRSIAVDVALVALGAGLIGALAQLYVPLWPVPVTGQTLAVLLVASTLGAVRGGAATVVYALLGGAGVPWFSEHAHGWAVLFGPTGGYILGFLPSALIVGALAERAWDRKILKALATFVGGSLVVFAVGLPWLAAYLGGIGRPNDLGTVLAAGLFPFLIGGAIKAVIAAALLPAAWWGASKLPVRPR